MTPGNEDDAPKIDDPLLETLASELWAVRGAEKELSEAVGHFLRACALLERNLRLMLVWYFAPADEELFAELAINKATMGRLAPTLRKAAATERGLELWHHDLVDELAGLGELVKKRNAIAHNYLGLQHGSWLEEEWTASVGDQQELTPVELDTLHERASELANSLGSLLNTRNG